MMTKRMLILAVLLVSVIAPAGAAVGAAGQVDGPDEKAAELSIQQPHYIDSDVSTSSANGTTVYHIRGGRAEIATQNFEAGDVVDYGVETQGGDAQLSYDRKFGEFVFNAESNGTYRLYWSVEEKVTVENETDNSTHVETRSQRYVAMVRIEGQTDMVHKPAGWDSELQQKAAKWDEFKHTVDELRGDSLLVRLGIKDEKSTDTIIQQMVTAYLTVHSPLQMLTGNFTAIVVLVGTTLGGWLFIATVIAPLLVTIGFAYYKLNRHESIEAQEGKLSERVADLDLKEAKAKLANWVFNDVTDDDYYAQGLREEGRNPLQAIPNRESKLSGMNVFHAYLQAMAQCGYVAVVDERLSPDGGDDDAGEIVDAHVAHEADVSESDETVSLEVDSPTDPLLEALDPVQDEIYEFDLQSADFDRSEVNPTPIDTYDLEDLVETTQLDLRRFGDAETAAKFHVEFLQDVAEHPISDDRGKVDSLRYWLEQNLDTANVINDRFPIPLEYRKRVWEAAIDEYDGSAEAEETLRDVQEGANA